MGEYRESKTGARLRFRRVPVFLVAARFASHWSGRKAAHVPLRAGMMSSSFPSPHLAPRGGYPLCRSLSLSRRTDSPRFPARPGQVLPPPLHRSARLLHGTCTSPCSTTPFYATLCYHRVTLRRVFTRLLCHVCPDQRIYIIYIAWRATASACVYRTFRARETCKFFASACCLQFTLFSFSGRVFNSARLVRRTIDPFFFPLVSRSVFILSSSPYHFLHTFR